MLQAFAQLNFSDEILKRFQDNVSTAFRRLVGPSGIPFLDGVRVSAIVAVGANVISHRLGRMPQGWIVTDISAVAAVTLYRSAVFSTTTITLTASAAGTVVLWIF